MLNKARKIRQEGKMINIEQFKDFQVAFEALRSKTVDVAIIEIREESGGEIFFECYVILQNRHSIRKLPYDYHRINDYDGFRTFKVFKSSDAVKKELS